VGVDFNTLSLSNYYKVGTDDAEKQKQFSEAATNPTAGSIFDGLTTKPSHAQNETFTKSASAAEPKEPQQEGKTLGQHWNDFKGYWGDKFSSEPSVNNRNRGDINAASSNKEQPAAKETPSATPAAQAKEAQPEEKTPNQQKVEDGTFEKRDNYNDFLTQNPVTDKKTGQPQDFSNVSKTYEKSEAAKTEKTATNPNTQTSGDGLKLGKGKTLGDMVLANKDQLSKQYGTSKLWGEGGLVDQVAKNNGFSGANDKGLNKLQTGKEFNVGSKAQTDASSVAADKKETAAPVEASAKSAPAHASQKKATPAAPQQEQPAANNTQKTPSKGYDVYSKDGHKLEPGSKEYDARENEINKELASNPPKKVGNSDKTAQAKQNYTPEQQKNLDTKLSVIMLKQNGTLNQLESLAQKKGMPASFTKDIQEARKLYQELQAPGSFNQDSMTKVEAINNKIKELTSALGS